MVSYSTGGGSGTVPGSPVLLTAVQWCFANTDSGFASKPLTSYVYDNGTAGVGATVTAGSNGALSIDSGSPAVGDRVLVADPYASGTGNPPHPDGIYTVTSAGSAGSKWVLTRASDNNTAALLGRFWACTIVQGTLYGGGYALVQALSNVPGVQTFVVGTSFPGLSVMAESSWAAGPWNTAIGTSAVAIGGQASADGNNATAVGNTATATGQTSTALGSYSLASGQESTTVGHQSFATGLDSVALGSFSAAYANGQISKASNFNSLQGDAQACEFYPCQQTANATPVNLVGAFNGQLKFRDKSNNDAYNKTMKVIMTVVARRTDSIGNDSVWTATGYLFGNGSNAYAWNGGTPPTFTQDVTHGSVTGWAVAASVATNILTVQVTGAAAQAINWMAKIETIEVAG